MSFKVLLLTDSDVYAGTEAHILTLSEGMIDLGVSVSIGCPVPSALAERACALRIPVVEFKRTRRTAYQNAAQIRGLFTSGTFDIVHAHNGKTAAIAAMARLTSRGGCGVATQHFIKPARTSSRGIIKLFRTNFHKGVCSALDGLIAVSEAVKAAIVLRKEAAAERVSVVWNGIPDPVCKSIKSPMDVRREFCIGADDRVLVCVARLEPEKSVVTLIRAFALIRESVKRVRCVIVGDGSEKRFLEEEVKRLDLSADCTLVGFRTDAMDIVNSGDVFVLPSAEEPFGLAIVEAMALGKPVVAVGAGGPLEIIAPKVTGELVGRSDPSSMAAALITLLENPEKRAAMGDAGRRRYHAMFRAETMSRATVNFYEQVQARRVQRNARNSFS